LKVLIAIDSSAVSERMLEEAVARPWPAGTIFHVANAIDVNRFSELPALIEDARREGERIVKAGAAKLAGAGHATESSVLWGPPRHAVSSFAKDWGADFILAGSHGHSVIGRFLMGSVAQGILRKAHCSVEIVRTRSEGPPASSRAMKILVATDGSPFSLAAARSVAKRPWPAGTVFQILSVEELVVIDTPIAVSSLSAVYPASLLEELMAHSRARARAAAESAEQVLTEGGLKIVEPQPSPIGDPRTIILDTAQLWGADLIVLGSHGRGGLDRLLMGSVSEAVAIHAHCSVEVVRSQVPAPREG
jgi:nucleotide-binding universal stress UspA family protein